jgi:hypothetical protein
MYLQILLGIMRGEIMLANHLKTFWNMNRIPYRVKDTVVVFLLCSFSNIFAQESIIIKGKIVDASTGNGIPYSTIEIYGANIGTSADGEGVFKLEVGNVLGDTVVFRVSAVAHEKQVIPVHEISFDNENVIKLKARTIVLKELVINSKKIKERSIRSANLNKHNIGGYSSKVGNQLAVYIANDEKVVGYISSVSYYITKNGVPNAPFRVRIYDFDSLSNGPGADILTQNLIISAKKAGWFEIDLATYKLQIPPDGFFVAIEWVETSPTYYYDVDIRGEIVKAYGPALGLYYDKHVANTWKKRFGNDWIMRNFKKKGENVKRYFRDKYSNALIGAEIKYVKE